MIVQILRYLSSGLILIPFICYFLNILINKSKKVSIDDGFNITKDIISEYDTINIIENTSSISYYNLKRKVIKLSSSTYYGNDLAHISIALLSAGISIVDKQKNKYIAILNKITNNLKLLYILPIATIIINFMTYTKEDTKIGIIIIIIGAVITYMLNNIIIESIEWIDKNLKKVKNIEKVNKDKIMTYHNSLLNLNNLIFIGELVSIIMMIAIFMDFKI